MKTYQQTYQRSLANPEEYWYQAARSIAWDKQPETILDRSNPPFYRWFKGGKLNTCYNAIDRHINDGYGSQTALIYDSPVTESEEHYSFFRLRDEIANTSGALKKLGVQSGDTVIVYMPMVPQTVIAMLACARIGAIHSVVFGGFASRELAARIDDAQPRVIMSASCGFEPGKIIDYKALLDEALMIAKHRIDHCLVLQRPQRSCRLHDGRDLDWKPFVEKAEPADCVPLDANHPLYILYTSGTTGAPKGIVRDNGGHAVAMCWTMKYIYDAKPGTVYWAASDVGWIVGHSYIVYAPLLNRNTTIVYEGKPVGTPDAGAFWRVVSTHKVETLFTAPTALRAIKREDPAGQVLKTYDLPSLNYLFLAGERSDPDTVRWAEKHLAVPVIDHWWQTETSWAIASNFPGIEMLPVKIGSVTKPVPGYDIKTINAAGEGLPPGTLGSIVVKLPLPPGTMTTLWKNDERFQKTYMDHYPGYYLTGDSGVIDKDGYVHIMSRIDDVINVAGHRLSTGQMEEVLCDHDHVAEAAVFGVKDAFKGELPLGLVVLNANVDRNHSTLIVELIDSVRSAIGAVAAFKLCAVVPRLPKTRSGKILRSTMRAIANGDEWKMPATIDDPAILDEITSALKTLGYADMPE